MRAIHNIHFDFQAFVIVLLCFAGCNKPIEQTTGSEAPASTNNRTVTFGTPKVTEEVEKQIYKSLSYFRNLANAIEKKVPGGNAGSRQSRQDYTTAATSFKLQYGITDADLDAIINKGDAQGWK
jgi:hypothetical protein